MTLDSLGRLYAPYQTCVYRVRVRVRARVRVRVRVRSAALRDMHYTLHPSVL